MSKTSEKNKAASEAELPFATLYRSELFLAPAKMAARAMLQTQHNVEALVQINRKLVDELRDVIRREQDAVLGCSDRMCQQMTDGKEAGFGGILETAAESAREISRAVMDAQSRSIEALREHASAAAKVANHAAAEKKAAT